MNTSTARKFAIIGTTLEGEKHTVMNETPSGLVAMEFNAITALDYFHDIAKDYPEVTFEIVEL